MYDLFPNVVVKCIDIYAEHLYTFVHFFLTAKANGATSVWIIFADILTEHSSSEL